MYTVEYSVRQDCFHVSNLETILETNRRTSLSKIDVDYRIIGIFNTYEEANEYAKEFRKLLEEDDEII